MNIQHLMIVIDPTTDLEQPCVRRAEQLADAFPNARFTLFMSDYIPALDGGPLFDTPGLIQARQSLLEHRQRQLEHLATSLQRQGFTVDTSVVWGKRYERHILKAISELQPDLVLKTTHRHGLLKRLVLNNADWYLIRHCPVPLWLVKQPDKPLKTFCASVDPVHESDKPAALDSKLVATVRALAEATGTDYRVVHCYSPLPHTLAFDAGLIADYDGYSVAVEKFHADSFHAFTASEGIDAAKQQLLRGYPEQVIPDYVEQNAISLLVMGAVSRSRLENALIGHTAERLLDDVTCDVLVIKPDGFVDPSKPS